MRLSQSDMIEIGTPLSSYFSFKYITCQISIYNLSIGRKCARLSQSVADISGPIFDTEPLQKVQNNHDNYNVFAIENELPKQPESVADAYLEEQGDTNITIDSLDMCYDREHDKQDDADILAQERDLPTSLIDKLKCEINDSNNRNKFLESSHKALVDKLKESKNSSNEYTRKINDLNQMISDMKKELFAHQETISIMSQEKEAQIKFYKTREDKELDKVIALENKVKVLDDIVYKTGQSVQTMNMLNRNCKTSFAKPEFLKKAQRANPRLYDIGCYNDNLALMLAPESDETIRLAKESRSKLSDLIRPFDYDQLNNLYDLFDLKVQLQDTKIAISELKKLIKKMKGKSVETKFEKPSAIQQPNAFKSQRQSVLVTAQILPQNVKSILKNTNVIALGMYKVHTKPNQTRTPQLSQDIRKTNKRVSFSTGVISTTSVSRPQLKRNQLEDREKFLGTVNFENDQIAPILGYGDLVQGNITIKRVYYVEGLNHNLISIGQFCDADLEVTFRNSTCYIRDLKGNDLLTGSRGTDLYSITLQDISTPNPICLMDKATSSQAWLWHRRLLHLNFDTINLLLKYDIVTVLPKLKFVKDHLCSSCELGKAKRYSTQSRAYRVYNKRTRVIVETIHVNFDELPQMTSDHVSSDPVPQCPTMALEHDSLSPGPQCQKNVPKAAETSSAVTTADAPNQRHQQHTTPSTSTTIVVDTPPLNIQTAPKTKSQTPTQTPTVTANENIIQAETNKEYAQVDEDEFINILVHQSE
ncbi:retrovirus-related pol polyprotein from transposon TNT 1-94 [Tanacetum coccineum]